jgi:hypothetical protein
MGRMTTLKVMRQLLKEWTLPDEMSVSWDVDKSNEVDIARERFLEYLGDGWMAFSDEPEGRRQIFDFDPSLERIVLLPPLGGG